MPIILKSVRYLKNSDLSISHIKKAINDKKRHKSESNLDNKYDVSYYTDFYDIYDPNFSSYMDTIRMSNSEMNVSEEVYTIKDSEPNYEKNLNRDFFQSVCGNSYLPKSDVNICNKKTLLILSF